jgi:predicted ester cyclase
VSPEENKLLVRRFYEEVVNTGDMHRLAEFIRPADLEGMRGHVLGVRETYPDLHLTVERQIAEGEWVVTCVTARGTHQGVWLGMRPTGKKVEMTGVNVDRVIDGRIVEHGGAANLLEPLLEIGAIRIADSVDESTDG